MSPQFEYLCQCGHTTEPLQKVHSDQYRCDKCKKYAKFTVSNTAKMAENWKV